MSQMLNKYNLFLSSSQRESGTPTDFNIIVKPNITLSRGRQSHFRLYVHSVCIPFSFTQIHQYNNTIEFNLTQGTKSFDSSFSIPAGNYNIYSLAQTFIDYLQQQLAVLDSYFTNITYTYDNDQNKVTFEMPYDDTGSVITFYNNSGFTAVNQCLGFNAPWTLTVASSTSSQIQVNVNPARNLYIYSNTISSPHNIEALTSESQISTQIMIIPLQVNPNLYIQYTPYNYLVSQVGNKTFSTINLQLQAEDQDINLQNFNLDWSLTLCIEEWETLPSLQDIMQQMLNLQVKTINDQAIQTQQQKNQLLEDKQRLVDELLKIRKKTEKNVAPILETSDNVQNTQEKENQPSTESSTATSKTRRTRRKAVEQKTDDNENV